jgi:hypothetical protein
MTRSFREWITEGEAIYTDALKEYQTLEAQIVELEKRLGEKKTEVNQIAQMIGKHPIEASKRVSAQIVEVPADAIPVGTVARALTGRGLVPR